ncbi:riboflavin synthase domain-like protein [Anaeromyces robustus]|uniref:Riboflavin synthase domain-like protein n=1 Tax=Anaeromyces robustus TaxID=1754192 RepID=A0A1Y1XEE6_9FUNG|nr:riboflavin synthase domain-like protein [Anaeromyces robustus]|eukprot:ORX84105.1 riboflavin synthase domain-like protein [Anaeromyces robustus]
MSLSINILYGSQNGTARNVAENLEKDLLNDNIPTTLLQLDDYKDAKYLDNQLNVIIISTTGDGESPDNAIRFYSNLLSREDFICNSLKNKKYALLGLGDSYFTYFCRPAKVIDSILQSIGSIKVIETAFGDDAKNLDETIESWVKDVKLYIKKSLPLGNEVSSISTDGDNTMEGIEFTSSDGNITDSNDSNSENDTQVGSIIETEMNIDIIDDANSLEYKPIKLSFNKELLSHITQLNHVIKKPISYLSLMSANNLYRSVNYSRTQQIFPLIPKINPYQTSNSNSNNMNNTTIYSSSSNTIQYSENNPFAAKILSANCLANNEWKKTLQITLDITNLHWNYEPGYVFGIIAPNSDKLVLPLLKRLGLNPEDGFRATTTKENLCSGLPVMLNKCYTYYEAFKYFININACPKKSFLRMLAEYCTNKEDKKQLYFLCSSQGAPYYRHLKLQHPSLLDVLYTFTSCQPPFVAILENSTRLAPRYYSITSSPLQNPTTISFIFNVDRYKMPNTSDDNKIHYRYGICTGWLDELLEKPSIPDCFINYRSKSIYIPIFPKTVNSFVLPQNAIINKNIIMAGAGTGIAPFISFIEYKRQLLEEGTLEDYPSFKELTSINQNYINDNDNNNDGNNDDDKHNNNHSKISSWCIFYGCRSFLKDNLIKDFNMLWKQIIENKNLNCKKAVLDDLIITTSREGEGPRYIQDAMKLNENAEKLCNLLRDKNTYFYVCGKKALCKGIQESLEEILQHYGNMSPEESKKFLDDLSNEKRYLRDIWG